MVIVKGSRLLAGGEHDVVMVVGIMSESGFDITPFVLVKATRFYQRSNKI